LWSKNDNRALSEEFQTDWNDAMNAVSAEKRSFIQRNKDGAKKKAKSKARVDEVGDAMQEAAQEANERPPARTEEEFMDQAEAMQQDYEVAYDDEGNPYMDYTPEEMKTIYDNQDADNAAIQKMAEQVKFKETEHQASLDPIQPD